MSRKNKIAVVRALTRRNATPMFCALVPQVCYFSTCFACLSISPGGKSRSKWVDRSRWISPHTTTICRWHPSGSNRERLSRQVSFLSFGIRLKTTLEIASDDMKDLARAWIDKLSVKNGAYPPDSYPNPGKRFPPFSELDFPKVWLHSLDLSQCTTPSQCFPRRVRSRFLRGLDVTQVRHDSQGEWWLVSNLGPLHKFNFSVLASWCNNGRKALQAMTLQHLLFRSQA